MAPGQGDQADDLGLVDDRQHAVAHRAAVPRADASVDVSPRLRWASTSRRWAPRSSRRRLITSDAVFMALEMIIDPRGMAARGTAGRCRAAGARRACRRRRPRPRWRRSSRRRAPACPGPPEVRVAVPTMTSRTRGVSAELPPSTKSSTKPMASSWAKDRNVATAMSRSRPVRRTREMTTATSDQQEGQADVGPGDPVAEVVHRRPTGRVRSANSFAWRGSWVTITTVRPSSASDRISALDARLGDGVEGRGGLVEQQALGVAGKGPGQAHALRLADREAVGVAAGQGDVEPHPGQELGRLGADIGGHRARERDRHLADVLDPPAQLQHVVGAHVAALEQDLAGVGVVEAVEQAQQCGLARPRWADHGGQAVGGDAGGEALDDRPGVTVDPHVAILEAVPHGATSILASNEGLPPRRLHPRAARRRHAGRPGRVDRARPGQGGGGGRRQRRPDRPGRARCTTATRSPSSPPTPTRAATSSATRPPT